MKEDKNVYAVEMINITKIFLGGKIIANDNINLNIKNGEIHALIGENGAGKSTLMAILFGLYDPTFGQIKINGQLVQITNPVRANKLGIGMVHQHFKLIEDYTVLQNIILGVEPVLHREWLDLKKAREKIEKIMNQYGLELDLDLKISKATVGQQQTTEILKMLYRDVNILVFDEPSAVLTPEEIKILLKIIKDLRREGKTIIFISHKLDEIKEIASQATVIRHGKVVGTFAVKDKTENEIAQLMVGRDLVSIVNTDHKIGDDVILELNNISVAKKSNPKILGLRNFSLKVNSGEIVSIAGVAGNGQIELVEAITGLTKVSAGIIKYKSEDITYSSIKKRSLKGMAHIPEDRHKYGLILDWNLINNIAIQNIDQIPFSYYGFLNPNYMQKYAQDVIRSYDIRNAQSGFSIARELSGGNQQKAIIGRELSRTYDLLIVTQPTRGLDVGAIEYIHKKLLEEKDKGKAILLISYELTEVMTLSDRIIVLNSGQNMGELLAKNARRNEIGLMMAGKYNKSREQVNETSKN